MEYGDHDAGNGHADTCFYQQDAEVLAMDRIMRQDGIIQEAAAHHHAGYADGCVGEGAQGHQHA